MSSYDRKQPGDPVKAAKAIIDTLLGEGPAIGKTFPKTLFLGLDAVASVEETLKAKLLSLEEWKDVSSSTNV